MNYPTRSRKMYLSLATCSNKNLGNRHQIQFIFRCNHMNKKFIVSILVGTAISTGGLYLAFRNIPFTDLWEYLATINYFWIIPAGLLGKPWHR